MRTILTFALLLFSCAVFSQQLVYRPVNPMFGGDTFNYQQLLNSANAQNSFTDPTQDEQLSELEEFGANLNRQILGQLGRSLFGDQLGDGLQPGTFNFGSLALEIFESAEGLVINILDVTTGEQTQIIIPQ